MNLKKNIGKIMAALAVVVIGAGAASMVGVGTEEMPNSLKNKR